MRPITIIDTGPLVAVFDEKDHSHDLTVSLFKTIQLPLISCEAVVAETCFLLSRHPATLERFGNWLHLGRILIPFNLQEESKAVFSLVKKYKNVPMSLADACLVRMAETNPEAQVFTLDSHFSIYRPSSRRVIRTIGLEK